MLFSRHIDGRLGRLAQGTLRPAAIRALVEHAKGCPRCRVRYDRFVLAQRALETGSPRGVPAFELAALQAAALPAVLRAARPGAPARRFPVLTFALASAALMAVVGGLSLLQSKPESEWATRGDGASTALLRAFCAPTGQPLRELKAEPSCQAGTTLVFAATPPPGKRHLAIALRGGGTEILLGPVEVPAPSSKPSPLEITPLLALPAGPAEIVGAFAEKPEDALAALRGPDTRAVIVRQPLQVQAP